MPAYKYKARDRSGKLVTGIIGGESKENVARYLENMEYIPIAITEKREIPFANFFEASRRVNREDLNLFSRQMVTLLKSGVPLVKSLQSVEEQTKSKVLKRVIQQLIRDVEGGGSFSEALSRQPGTFTELYAKTVKAGEVSGMMEEVLSRLADLGEFEADTISKIKIATRYPIFALCVLFIGFIIMTMFVLPRFVQLFAQMNTKLPLPTLIVIKISYLLQNYWFLVLLILIGTLSALIKFVKTDSGKKIWDGFTLNMPIFGKLVNMLIMSRFSRIMAIMVKSGVPILDVIDTVSETVGNAVLSAALVSVKMSVQKGKSIAEPMRISGVFSPIVVQMVAIGEETGKLDELLTKVSEYYDQQSDYMIKNLSTLIEPVFIIIIAGGVLLLALSVFLPMWDMFSALRGK